MKRIKALIALISVCLTLLFTFASGTLESLASTDEWSPSFASFRIYASQSVSDEAVKIQFSFSLDTDLHYRVIQIVAINGENVLHLDDYVPPELSIYWAGTKCILLNWYYDCVKNGKPINSHENGKVFAGSEKFEYNIPMEFFEGETGEIRITFGEYVDGKLVEYGPKADLITYTKTSERIYFGTKEHGEY